MFNKTILVAGRTEYVPYEKSVTVHEHKAPTDDSIKLYEEIKEKAYNSIIRTLKSGDNELVKYDAIVYKDMYTFDTIVKFRIILNGAEIIDGVKLDECEVTTLGDVAHVVYARLSEKIALLLLQQIPPADIVPKRPR